MTTTLRSLAQCMSSLAPARRGARSYYVKSSNAEKYDEFGGSVALSRDGRTMLASAHAEDGGSKGAGGNQADNSVSESGAVYVFGY